MLSIFNFSIMKKRVLTDLQTWTCQSFCGQQFFQKTKVHGSICETCIDNIVCELCQSM